MPLERFEFDLGYIERLVAGDPETERHFTRYFGDLLTLKLRSRLRSAAQVEDAKQETFVRVLTTLKKKGGIASPEALGAFVNSVCNNVLFETYRSGSKVHAARGGLRRTGRAAARRGIDTAASEERARGSARRWPACRRRTRSCCRLLFFEERDKDDICQELNVDRNYLRVLLHRAKAHFRGFAGRERDAMTHEQAVSTLAAGRYLLDEMPEPERETFEEHYFSCAECAEDVRTGALMRDGVGAGLMHAAAGRATDSRVA